MGTCAACCSPRCRSSLCCLARTFPDPFPASRPSCYRCYRLVRRRRCSLSQAQPRRKCHRVPHSLVPAKLHMSLARRQESPPRKMPPSSSMRTMIASCLFPFPHRCRAFAKWTPGRSPAGRDVTPLGGTLQLSQDRNLASATRTRPLKGAPPRGHPGGAAQFSLLINLKTAKTLGLTIPSSLLQRADQVIEGWTGGAFLSTLAGGLLSAVPRPLQHRQRGRPSDGVPEDDHVRGHAAHQAGSWVKILPRQAPLLHRVDTPQLEYLR
jgi:hypothetical protein